MPCFGHRYLKVRQPDRSIRHPCPSTESVRCQSNLQELDRTSLSVWFGHKMRRRRRVLGEPEDMDKLPTKRSTSLKSPQREKLFCTQEVVCVLCLNQMLHKPSSRSSPLNDLNQIESIALNLPPSSSFAD